MGKYFLSMAMALLILGACKNDNTTETNNLPPEPAPAEANNGLNAGELEVYSEQTKRVVAALTRDYWVMEVYVKIKDKEAGRLNKGRWYNLNTDGTFTSGQWLKQTGKGVWKYNQANGTIHLDADNDLEDSEYSIKISNDESVMIWIGTDRYAQNSIQAKMGNYIELPASFPTPENNPG